VKMDCDLARDRDENKPRNWGGWWVGGNTRVDNCGL